MKRKVTFHGRPLFKYCISAFELAEFLLNPLKPHWEHWGSEGWRWESIWEEEVFGENGLYTMGTFPSSSKRNRGRLQRRAVREQRLRTGHRKWGSDSWLKNLKNEKAWNTCQAQGVKKEFRKVPESSFPALRTSQHHPTPEESEFQVCTLR